MFISHSCLEHTESRRSARFGHTLSVNMLVARVCAAPNPAATTATSELIQRRLMCKSDNKLPSAKEFIMGGT